MANILTRATVVLDGDSKGAEDAMKKTAEHLESLGEHVGEVGEKITEFFSLEIAALGAEAVHAFAENEDSLAKVNGVLQATGGVAGVTADHIIAMSEALQEQTRFMHDETQAAAALALTYTAVRNTVGAGNDIFDRTIKASQDLATVMGGDLDGAVQQLGRALEDPQQGLMNLRRAGIIFSASQEETVREMYLTNDVLGAQKVILGVVEGRVKDLAKAYLNTPAGQLKALWIQVHEAFEAVGSVIWNLLKPGLEALTAVIKDVTGWFNGLSDNMKELLVMLIAIAAAVGPVMILVGGFTALTAALEALDIAFVALTATAALWTVGIGLIIAAGVLLYKNWDKVKLAAAMFWQFLKQVFFDSITWIVDKLATFTASIAKVHGAFAVLATVPGMQAFGILGDVLGNANDDMQALSKSTHDWATDSLKESSIQVAKLAQAVLDDDNAKKKNTTTTTKAAKQEDVWAAAAKKALFDYNNAAALAATKSKLLGDQFDYAGAMADANTSLVAALAAGFVPLDAALTSAGDTFADFIKDQKRWQQEGTMQDLNVDMKNISATSAAMGIAFDEAGARSSALDSKIQDLIKQGTSLTEDLGGAFGTLQNMINLKKFEDIQSATYEFGIAEKQTALYTAALGSSFDSTSAEAENYGARVQKLVDDHVALNQIVDENGSTLQDLISQWHHLQDVSDISAGLRKTFGDLSDFVAEFAFDSTKSFGDFVRSALLDLDKLFLRILEMRLLKSIFGGSDIFGSAASFLSGGDNVTSGSGLFSGGGVTVGDPTAVGVRSPSNGIGTIQNNFSVNAIDQKGVADFFENNQSYVAGAMLSTFQKSAALRGRIGGR